MLKKQGKIIKWDDIKGYGFILPQDSKKHIFVHIKSFTNKNIRPSVNQNVTYKIQKDTQGKQSATNVIIAFDTVPNHIQNSNKKKKLSLKSISNNSSNYKVDYKSTHKISMVYILFILSFLSFLIFSFMTGRLPFSILILYVIMGSITYAAYSSDKSKAITKEYRISEKLLHILSLMGGWMGAMLAQQRFRHKTQKSSFQVLFWITVLCNIAVVIYEFKLL